MRYFYVFTVILVITRLICSFYTKTFADHLRIIYLQKHYKILMLIGSD